MTPSLELRGASKVYQAAGRGTAGLYPTTLEVFSGEVVLLVGPSGSGKTTLLTLAAGLVAPTAGTVLIGGEPLDALSPSALQRLRARRLGFVFQSFNLIDALTVLDNVALVLRFSGYSRRRAREQTEKVLADIGISHLSAQVPSQLSQGEKQRVAVARAVVSDPAVILADEPTASLDTDNGLEVTRVLHQHARDHRAALLVATHDLRLAEYADRVIELRDGRIQQPSNHILLKVHH
jgi:putative ABC transport system ATP-binding protein